MGLRNNLNNSTNGIIEILETDTNSHCVSVNGTIEKAICNGGKRPTDRISINSAIKLILNVLFEKILILSKLLFVLQFTACNICIKQMVIKVILVATSLP